MTIHPTAIIDPGAQIGEGTRIWHWTHAIVFLPWMFLLFFVPQGGKSVGRIWMWLGWLGLGVIIAVGVEVMQLWVPHRAFSPMDGVFGVVGVVVGGGLVLLQRLIR